MQFEQEMRKIEAKLSLKKRANSSQDVFTAFKFGGNRDRSQTTVLEKMAPTEDKKGGSPDVTRKQRRRAFKAGSTRTVFALNPRGFNEHSMRPSPTHSPPKAINEPSVGSSSPKKRKASGMGVLENRMDTLTFDSPRFDLKEIEKIPEEKDEEAEDRLGEGVSSTPRHQELLEVDESKSAVTATARPNKVIVPNRDASATPTTDKTPLTAIREIEQAVTELTDFRLQV